ncbi:KGG domain-containing protein (plasmid) [Pantoea sp. BRR-3P]|uniref:general stress protein n=1 Tax=unclassified Pantoea TaxID=2630326 RepID=UPI00092D3342|nr:KGG domain-containing protein [Pantoea sp. RIT-PI-b]
MNKQSYRGGAGNFANNPERAKEAGSAGGKASGGNFKNNPERAVEAGRKGGQISRRPPKKSE